LIALGVAVALLAAMSAGAVYAYTSLKQQATALEARLVSHLELGQKELEAAKASLKLANTSHDEKKISEAKVHFIAAKLQFLAASQIADGSDLLRQLESLPTVGEMARSRHVAVNAVSEMGIQISTAGVDLADLDGQLVKPPSGSQQGQGLLTVVKQVQSKVVSVESELKSAMQASELVDLNVFPPGQRAAFLKAKGSIAQALTAIQQFKELVPIIIELLGGNGPRNYLIEQVNPAELRAGGGFIGSYSILHADHGALTLIKSSGDAYDLMGSDSRPRPGMPGYVKPPGPFLEFIPLASWSFVDSNFFPDFPSNAASGIQFVGPKLGIKIDAVFALDYYVVARLVALAGPTPVPGYNITLTGDNLVTTLLDWDLRAISDPYAGAVHKAMLTSVSGPLLQRVVALPASQWPQLIASLNDMAASRHLQAWFANGDAQKAIDQYGWSAVMKPKAATDYMMETEDNLGGTKANYFMDRHYKIELTRNGGTLHHKMSVQVWDNMPYSYRPNEFYRAYVRLYVSDKATGLSNDLTRPYYKNPPPPAGTLMSDGWFTIHGYGHDRVTVFEWDTPWQPNGRGQQQIYWQKQPGTLVDNVDIIWNDGNGHQHRVSGNLAQDRVITLAPTGVTFLPGQLGTAQLPSLGLG
jgi:hypothetical protein